MVLNYLHDFFVTEWAEEVYIPLDILNQMAMWLADRQTDDGAFPEMSDHVYTRWFQVEH